MEGEEGGIRLSKRFSEKDKGEVDYKTKAGTAWSHSYLNQKPWHPLSYPNQRRKWIAEQTHANRERRAEEVAREAGTHSFIHSSIPPSFFGFSVFQVAIFFLLIWVMFQIVQYAQEQEFFRQTALISKKEKEKVSPLLFLLFFIFRNGVFAVPVISTDKVDKASIFA